MKGKMSMKRRFELNGFQIATYTNISLGFTIVTIVKDEKILMNNVFPQVPWKIDYTELIENI
jgi:hypothetical protein